eukprot:2552131-Pleurochrysis_carterae.AAC.1
MAGCNNVVTSASGGCWLLMLRQPAQDAAFSCQLTNLCSSAAFASLWKVASTRRIYVLLRATYSPLRRWGEWRQDGPTSTS